MKRTIHSCFQPSLVALLCCAGMHAPVSAAALPTRAVSAPAFAARAAEPSKLDTLLAPIALYPDALVLQMLECSSAPDQIDKLNSWIKANPDVKGSAAQDAAVAAGFTERFVDIVLFPQAVKLMADKPDWTRELAKAFKDDRSAVFASIQSLRKQAKSVGNLATNEQQNVQTVTTGGTEVIVIQPANPQVVYVPQYNPTVVYTQPPPAQAAGTGLVAFTAGVIIGAAIADDDCSWGYRGSCLSNEGYDDFTDHRQDMAAQRGANQSNRQDSRTEKQSGRQDSRTENQGNRQENRGGQSASGQSASPQAARGSANEARGSTKSASAAPSQRAGTTSSATSGYQSGAKEREASARGRSSTAPKSSGSRGGGGGKGGRGR